MVPMREGIQVFKLNYKYYQKKVRLISKILLIKMESYIIQRSLRHVLNNRLKNNSQSTPNQPNVRLIYKLKKIKSRY